MTRLDVDLDLLEEVVDRMAAFERRFEVVCDDVAVRLRRVDTVWTGRAAAEQSEARQRWTAGAQEMRDALVGLRSIAAVARHNYLAAVRANLAMWSL